MSQYQLTLNDEQVQMLLRALDVYSRVGCGQFDRILEMFCNDPRLPEGMLAIQWETLFCSFKQRLLQLQKDASYSICAPEVPADYRLAWDVLQVIRHHIAWEEQPEGGHLVKFDPPMNTCSSPFCTIETVIPEQVDSDQAATETIV